MAERMRIAIAGGTGLIGGALAADLAKRGHDVRVITRSPRNESDIGWDPLRGMLDRQALAGCDAVVNLAGVTLFQRWNEKKKELMRESRIASTRLLSETLAAGGGNRAALVSASAVGYYGDRGDEILSEDSPPGEGWLARLCQDWEAACDPARQAGHRVATLRMGPVLTPQGGMLRTILPLFRLGLGGRLAGGRQWMSWIALDDLTEILRTMIQDDSRAGIFNALAPGPVTNDEFTRTLGKVLGRPTLLPAPRFGIALVLGREGADQFALPSVRARPARLLEGGYAFRHEALEPALRSMLGRE